MSARETPHAPPGQRLADTSPDLVRILARSTIRTPARFAVSMIRCEMHMVAMRDGVRLATDLYLPPSLPAPTVAVRTCYGRGRDEMVGVFLAFARRGYVVVAQDCRGTGDSESASWDMFLHEPEDGFDLVEWVSQQPWFDGFLGACGGSYVGQTQWHMGVHPRTSTIVPEMTSLVTVNNGVHLHMFANAYSKSVGKGAEKVAVHITEMERYFHDETMNSGYYNEPLNRALPDELLNQFPNLRELPPFEAKRWLWSHYSALPSCAERVAFVKKALGVRNVTISAMDSFPDLFGLQCTRVSHPRPAEVCRTMQAPVLLCSGWYDWGLNNTLATWELLMHEASPSVRANSRLFIAPTAHNAPGYHEGMDQCSELQYAYRTVNMVEVLLNWYAAIRENRIDSWPRVLYYLMGANEWRVAQAWPVPEARMLCLYLAAGGALRSRVPTEQSSADSYTYDPQDPTPTVGGSIVSYLYPPGSVDVSKVHRRSDVLTYTTDPLPQDLDVVGPMKLVLYASSSAPDTDFSARLSDVFPDGRAIQLQSGILRARYRDPEGAPALLEPGRIYRLEIDLWSTANRFKAGHRLRVDICSADFPRFDRNSNRGGAAGPPVIATQTVYHDQEHASHLLLPMIQSPYEVT